MKARNACLIALVLSLAAGWSQSDGFDEEGVALIYHKISGEKLDVQQVAEMSDAVRRASNFDRPDAVKAEAARLQAKLDSADPSREFTLQINDSISQYDHDRSEFSINLFTPGHYVPVQAFGQQYQLLFANADSARAIPMAKEEARNFDTQMNQMGRSVTNEVKFKVIGQGDPAGGVTGERVVRAEILSSRLLDGNGAVVFTPQVKPFAAAAAAAPLDPLKTDVAGLRLGVKAGDLEPTLARLFGPVKRGKVYKAKHYAGQLSVDELGCQTMIGRKRPPLGKVCVTAAFDENEVIRSIHIERVFGIVDQEVFRKSAVQKYGSVAGAQGGANAYVLYWGPQIGGDILFEQSAPQYALTARYSTNEELMDAGMNRIPDIRLELTLIDAAWAASLAK